MSRRPWVSLLVALPLLSGCVAEDTSREADVDHRAQAERFFRGVFGCEPAAIDELAGDDIVVSYPIFETIFGRPSIQGREAVKDFSAGFCSRWTEPEIVVHESLQDGDRVVLVWEFEATSATTEGEPTRQSWGGISVFRFDALGLVIEEVGEESTPGPAARLRASP